MPVSRYVCIALVSAAALLFQVAQTRLFSSSYGYHLTYLVISVSLLGVGSGATLSGVFDRRSKRPALSTLALAAAASALAALLLETHIDPGVALAAAILVAYVVGALPFVFASWIVVRSLREAPNRAGRLYSVDLAGAAIGSLFAFVGLPSLGAPGLYGASACLSALAAIAVAGPRIRPAAGVVSAFALTIALTLTGDAMAPPQSGPAKRPVYGGNITHLETRWDPHARVDVIHYEGLPTGEMYRNLIDPGYTAPRPDANFMLLDQSAATQILDGHGDMSVLRASIIAAPYELLSQPHVLIIGPGGGIDIQNALVHKASRVDAVEVNRGVTSLMRGPMADYSGHVYSDARVNVVEDEARSYIRRSSDRYDLILMTVVDSYAALASGAYALSESYLYTAEAFDDYLGHVADHGVLAVGRFYRDPPIEMLNTAALGVDALSRRGVADPLAHLVVLRYLDFGLLIVRADAFDAASAAAIRSFATDHQFTVAFDPLDRTGPFAESLASTPVPATDNRPFFFANDPGAHVPVAYLILFGALIPAVVLSWGLLLLPLRKVMGAALVTALGRRTTVQALAVCFGFIAAEIVLLQRLTLYLGQPALALAVGLAALLVGAAGGSAASAGGRIGVARAALASAIVVTVAFLAFDRIGAATLSWPLLARGATASVVSIAIGLPLGSVFPTVIASAGAQDDGLVAWAWAVNGAASVVGSILAVVAALAIGFTGVGFLAAACYLIAVVPAATGLRLAVGAKRSPQPT
jgi:predicted membrane-bound spermidine synthase